MVIKEDRHLEIEAVMIAKKIGVVHVTVEKEEVETEMEIGIVIAIEEVVVLDHDVIMAVNPIGKEDKVISQLKRKKKKTIVSLF